MMTWVAASALRSHMHPHELKSLVDSSLLSFPLTDSDANGDFDRKGYIQRLE
jgi:5-dehydro-4-deoxyglucarate dehydratase